MKLATAFRLTILGLAAAFAVYAGAGAFGLPADDPPPTPVPSTGFVELPVYTGSEPVHVVFIRTKTTGLGLHSEENLQSVPSTWYWGQAETAMDWHVNDPTFSIASLIDLVVLTHQSIAPHSLYSYDGLTDHAGTSGDIVVTNGTVYTLHSIPYRSARAQALATALYSQPGNRLWHRSQGLATTVGWTGGTIENPGGDAHIDYTMDSEIRVGFNEIPPPFDSQP
jgi:hypothetical protein